MLIGVVGAAKATGVTTVAAGLGAAFGAAGQEALVIESDVAGGDLAYVRDLNVDTAGVLGFAAQMLVDVADENSTIGDHVWRSPRSKRCAVMPLAAGGVGIATQVGAMWKDGREVLSRWPGPVLLDLGRWGDALTENIWNGCDIGVVVCPGSLAGLRRAEADWDTPPMRNPFPTWRLVNGSPWNLKQIHSDTNLGFDAVLDWDKRCADHIRMGNWSVIKRRHLSRQLGVLAHQITADREAVRP